MKRQQNSFRIEIGKLRLISDQTRKDHDKIINWVDGHYFRTGATGKALAFVLPTKGCKYARAKHGGCSFCTLPTDNPWNPSEDLLASLPQRCIEIFQEKKKADPALDAVKFYTSGSFLDPWEIPLDVRESILRLFSEQVSEIVVESRCEYVTSKQLGHMASFVPPNKITIAIGQETTNDEINERANNKGHSFRQFQRAVKLAKKYGFKVKGYILLKPIFVSESLAVQDAIKSGLDMLSLGVDGISINPCYIGKGTLMEKLFKEGKYTPPWLWSVLKVTQAIKEQAGTSVPVISDPVAAGHERGPKNCGKCDRTFKDKLKEFSSTQKVSLLDDLQCDCEEIYHNIMAVESLISGTGVIGVRGH